MTFGFRRTRRHQGPTIVRMGREVYRAYYPYAGRHILTVEEYIEKLRAAEYLVAVCTPTGDQEPSCWNSGWLYPPVHDDQCSVIPSLDEVFEALGLPESDLGRVYLTNAERGETHPDYPIYSAMMRPGGRQALADILGKTVRFVSCQETAYTLSIGEVEDPVVEIYEPRAQGPLS